MITVKNTSICFLFFVFSCKHRPSEIKKTEINDLGEKVVSEMRVKGNDTIITGRTNTYYKSGKLKKTSTYFDNIKNGIETEYDTSGNIRSVVLYVNGNKDGYEYIYQENLIEKNYFLDGKKISNERMDAMRRPIQIQIFNLLGKPQYVVLFEQGGRKIYENGFVFEDSVFFIKPDKDNLSINKPINMKLFSTKISNYSREIIVEYFNHLGVKMPVKANIVNQDFFTSIELTPLDSGKQTLLFIGKLLNDSGKIVKIDTFPQVINVH